MKLKKNLSIFLTAFSFLMFSLAFTSCSADIPTSDDLEDNTVVVYYNEDEATVVAASNITVYVSATIKGA